VGFTITLHTDPAQIGSDADGSAATIDPIIGYQFVFDVPTLNADANLAFTIDMAALDSVERANLLNSLGSGVATIVGKADAAGSMYAAFPVCAGSQTPAANQCVAIEYLTADGTPTTGNPAFVRFSGVVGHFSTYAIATITPRDVTPPTITVPAGVVVEATSPAGATVSYTVSASDDLDPAPSVACTPTSGGIFAIGTTTVACTASDASGNSANAHFDVRVRGAAEQIERLLDRTLSSLDRPSLRPAFQASLRRTARAIVAGRPKLACAGLEVYKTLVRHAPSRTLSELERVELLADATRIQAVIGCR
jgi:hypothetical protein